MFTICNVICIPVITGVNGRQPAAVFEHGAHIGDFGRIKVGEVQTCQPAAVVEHEVHIGDVGCIKSRDIQARQPAAAPEHIAHISNVGCIEARGIQARQPAAAAEHRAHAGDVGCIEVGEVQTCQPAAVFEHAVHIGDFGGIKQSQVFDCCQLLKPRAVSRIRKHRVRIRIGQDFPRSITGHDDFRTGSITSDVARSVYISRPCFIRGRCRCIGIHERNLCDGVLIHRTLIPAEPSRKCRGFRKCNNNGCSSGSFVCTPPCCSHRNHRIIGKVQCARSGNFSEVRSVNGTRSITAIRRGP